MSVGNKCSFLTEDNSVQTYVYQGGTFTSADSWAQGNGGSSGGNMILKWDTDKATTRKQVKMKQRRAGMLITYKHPTEGWVNEQYNFSGANFDVDGNWELDRNWQPIHTHYLMYINISHIYPTDGVEGTNKYDLSSAIKKIPSSLLNRVGLECSFFNADGIMESYVYEGGKQMEYIDTWKRKYDDSCIIVDWRGDKSKTRAQIPLNNRRPGLIVSYNDGSSLVTEQYTYSGDKWNTGWWPLDKYWIKLAKSTEIEDLSNAVENLSYDLKDKLKEVAGLFIQDSSGIASGNMQYSVIGYLPVLPSQTFKVFFDVVPESFSDIGASLVKASDALRIFSRGYKPQVETVLWGKGITKNNEIITIPQDIDGSEGLCLVWTGKKDNVDTTMKIEIVNNEIIRLPNTKESSSLNYPMQTLFKYFRTNYDRDSFLIKGHKRYDNCWIYSKDGFKRNTDYAVEGFIPVLPNTRFKITYKVNPSVSSIGIISGAVLDKIIKNGKIIRIGDEGEVATMLYVARPKNNEIFTIPNTIDASDGIYLIWQAKDNKSDNNITVELVNEYNLPATLSAINHCYPLQAIYTAIYEKKDLDYKIYGIGDSTNSWTNDASGDYMAAVGSTKIIGDILKASVCEILSVPGTKIIEHLAGMCAKIPDDANLVICVMGINDVATVKTLGDIDEVMSYSLSGLEAAGKHTTSVFGVYRYQIQKLRERLPQNAQILCVTPFFNPSWDDPSFPWGYEDLQKFRAGVRLMCKILGSHKGYKFVDGLYFGFNNENHDDYYTDGTHPNMKGQTMIARKLLDFITPPGIANAHYNSKFDGMKLKGIEYHVETFDKLDSTNQKVYGLVGNGPYDIYYNDYIGSSWTWTKKYTCDTLEQAYAFALKGTYVKYYTPIIKGNTAQRNKMLISAYQAGHEYYDTTLKRKVLWNGSEWTNLDGSSLV